MPDKKIVNVTAKIVARDILDALADGPDYPYQLIFSTPYYQQMLVARVLSSICNNYVVYKRGNRAHYIEILLYFLEEKAAIKVLVQESMVRILEEDCSWTDFVQMPDNVPIIYVTP